MDDYKSIDYPWTLSSHLLWLLSACCSNDAVRTRDLSGMDPAAVINCAGVIDTDVHCYLHSTHQHRRQFHRGSALLTRTRHWATMPL